MGLKCGRAWLGIVFNFTLTFLQDFPVGNSSYKMDMLMGKNRYALTLLLSVFTILASINTVSNVPYF